MALPRFLAENFFHGIRFGDHTISANEAATGNEAFRVGDGRRKSTYWTPTTDNSEATIQVECDRGRAADVVVIDRNSNLGGETVHLEASDDNFSTTETIFTETIPTTTSPNQRLSDGARSAEGAWMRSFDSRIATYWRLRIDAMGAGLKPEITGLYLGNSWQPDFHIAQPWGWGDINRAGAVTTSDAGWQGEVGTREVRERTFTIKLSSFSEYAVARYHTRGLYWRGDPMWVWPDQSQAEKGWLSQVPQGTHRWQMGQDQWAFMQTELQARELEAELR